MKIISHIIIGFLLIISLAFSSEDGTWKIIENMDFNYGLSTVFFECTDSMNCMKAIYFDKFAGYIVRRTTDGGDTWKTLMIDTNFNNVPEKYYIDLYAMQYPSKNLCIIVGDSGLIMRSTDNGDNWDISRKDSFMLYQSVGMYDDYDGFMTGGRTDSLDKGAYLRFWRTSDMGKSWHEKPRLILPKMSLRNSNLQIVNKNLIIGDCFCRDNNGQDTYKLVKIYNDWLSWDTISKPAGYTFFLDENNGWVAGAYPYSDTLGYKRKKQMIFHTSDGGKTWEIQRDKFFRNLWPRSIKFYDENFGICGTEDQWVLFTFDGGKTWSEVKTNLHDSTVGGFFDIVKIIIPTENIAYMFSSWPDEIIKWTRKPTSVIEKEKQDLTITPNPASDYIEIYLDNHTLKGVVNDISVYDLLGVEVQNGMDSRLRGNDIQVRGNDTPPAPSQEGVRIDVSHLSPGVYFVRIGNIVQKFVKY